MVLVFKIPWMKSHRGSLFLAIALVVSSIIISFGLTKMKSTNNYVTVKGLSERQVVADKAWWSIVTQITANTTEEMQFKLQNLEKTSISFLKQNGFLDEEISSATINIYRSNYKDAAARLNGDFKMSVSTDQIDKVQGIIKETGALISKGILLQSDQWTAGPKFYFTKFKDLKKDMLAEATREAKDAAGEFANNSGSKVGEIRRANQGVFQILPGDRTPENEMFYAEKIVRVVSTVDYYLE